MASYVPLIKLASALPIRSIVKEVMNQRNHTKKKNHKREMKMTPENYFRLLENLSLAHLNQVISGEEFLKKLLEVLSKNRYDY